MGAICDGISDQNHLSHNCDKLCKQASSSQEQLNGKRQVTNISMKIEKHCIQVNQFPLLPSLIQNRLNKLKQTQRHNKSQKHKQTQKSKENKKFQQNQNLNQSEKQNKEQYKQNKEQVRQFMGSDKMIKKVPKIYKCRGPYNFFFKNLSVQNYENIYPRGQCIIIKQKQSSQFNGYFHGYILNLNSLQQPQILPLLIIFPNGSYYQSTNPTTGIYYNQSSGLKYQGQWLNDLPHGSGKEKNNKGIYQGQYQKGEKSGSGNFIFNQNIFIQAQFYKGYFHGKGKITDKETGYSYEGQFCSGEKHGQGRQKTTTDIYQGFFSHGYRQGCGKLQTFLNSNNVQTRLKTYQGQFHLNEPHGRGTLTLQKNLQHQMQKIKGFFTKGQLSCVTEI